MCPFVKKKRKKCYVQFNISVLRNYLHYFFNPVQPPLLFQLPLLLIINTMSNPPIIPTPPIIRESRVTLYLIVSCGKHLCQSLFFSQVADPRLLHLCGYRKCFSSHPAFRSLVQKWNIYSDQKKITVTPFKGRVLTLFIMESMSYLLVTYMCMDFLVTFFNFVRT